MQFRDFLGADEVKARLSGGPERFSPCRTIAWGKRLR